MRIYLWAKNGEVRKDYFNALSAQHPVIVCLEFPEARIFDEQSIFIPCYANPDEALLTQENLREIAHRCRAVAVLVDDYWQLWSRHWPDVIGDNVILQPRIPPEYMNAWMRRLWNCLASNEQSHALERMLAFWWAVRVRYAADDWLSFFKHVYGTVTAMCKGQRGLLLMTPSEGCPSRLLATEGFGVLDEWVFHALGDLDLFTGDKQGLENLQEAIKKIYEWQGQSQDLNNVLLLPLYFRQEVEGYMFLESVQAKRYTGLALVSSFMLANLIRVYRLESGKQSEKDLLHKTF